MSAEKWQGILENALTGVFQDIKTVEVMQYGTGEQLHTELGRYIEGMKKMRLEELLIESGVKRMLIVKHVYDDVYAVVRFGDSAHVIDLSRLIRIAFSQKLGDSQIITKRYVSAPFVNTNIRRWGRSVALVFGERYASKLLATAMRGRDTSAMSMENMDEVRAFISSSLGECLIFEPEKVDK
jgi:hypothetical protein